MKKPEKRIQSEKSPSGSSAEATLVSAAPQGGGVPLIYADSIGNLLMGPITTRVTLVLNAGPAKEGVQPTLPTMEIVMPTPSLLAFSKQLQQLLQSRGMELAQAYENAGKQIAELAAEVKKQG